MPIVVPPFVPYQAPLIPIRGLWNNPPPEGDRFIPVEIDWGVTTGLGMAVQISISAFSPVEFSQVCALNVDNGRNGADVDFLFPDTGRQLTVPAYCQGMFPIISNAMTFYVVSQGANVGDITVFEICNSIPPPVAILPSQEQSHANQNSISLTANGSTPVVPAGITGTVQSIAMVLTNSGATQVSANIFLVDGANNLIWAEGMSLPAESVTPINLTGLRIRFTNGIVFNVTSAGAGTAFATVNIYYSVP